MTDATILEKINDNSFFRREDLQFVMEECGYKTSKNIINHLINRLLIAGIIVRVARNRYCVTSALETYKYQHSEAASSIADEIVKAHPYLDFRILELVQLNEFVRHQIAHNIIFVSVEAGLEEYVFNTLWEKHKGSILIKPDADELFHYMNDDMIVILKLPSESPKGIDLFWDTRLEKILVDIAVDKLLRKIVYCGEYKTIYKDSFHRYAIDRSMMFRYARRRGALEKYKKFLTEEAELTEEDLKV